MSNEHFSKEYSRKTKKDLHRELISARNKSAALSKIVKNAKQEYEAKQEEIKNLRATIDEMAKTNKNRNELVNNRLVETEQDLRDEQRRNHALEKSIQTIKQHTTKQQLIAILLGASACCIAFLIGTWL